MKKWEKTEIQNGEKREMRNIVNKTVQKWEMKKMWKDRNVKWREIRKERCESGTEK